MISAIEKLKEINFYQTGQKLLSVDLINAQKILKQNKNAILPEEFVEFLHCYNGFSFEGGHIFGVFNENVLINNLIVENNFFDFKEKIVLGKNEFDYLVFDENEKKYQILDKIDFEMLEEFDNFDDGFFYIIKL